MAAWDDDLRWNPERYDRLEALVDFMVASEGFYPDITLADLSVEPGVTGGDGQVGTDPPTERLAAA